MQTQTNPVRPTAAATRRCMVGEVGAFALVLLPLAALIGWRG